VNLSKHPLQINVGFLLNQPIGYSRDIHFDLPRYKFEDDFRVIDFTGTARVNRTPQGILLLSDFQCSSTLSCVRCLAEFMQPLHTNFNELFAFNDRSTTESNLILPEDGNIDLEPLAREYLLLEIPISPLCRPDCKGLCPVCGEDLNKATCVHAAQASY
jgi:uncharacterized protein